MTDTWIAIGDTVKTYKSDDGATGYVEALGLRFGSPAERDAEGDWFGADTDYGFDHGDNKPASLNHRVPMVTKDTTPDDMPILESYARRKLTNPVRTEVNELGILARHALDLKNEYEAWVYEQAERGTFKWSSGAVGHMVDRDDETGQLKTWLIGEWAYTPVPAEWRLPAIAPLKSLQAAFTADVIPTEATQETTAQETAEPVAADVTGQADDGGEIKSQKEGEKMSEQTEAAPAVEPTDNGLAEIKELLQGVAAQQKAFADRLEAVEQTPVNDVPPAKSVNINTTTADVRQYDNVDTGALALGAAILKSANKHVSESLYKAIGMRLEGDADTNRAGMSYKSFGLAAKAFNQFARGQKANELVYSTQTDSADEWIGVAYSGELWDLARNETMIWDRIPSIEFPPGAESIVIPTLEGSVTFYKVAEATDMGANPGATTNTVTVSKQTTGNSTMTLGKLGAGVTWTGEVTEGSVVMFAEQLRNDLVVTAAEYLDALAINGDTDASATTNINDIGGTPAATEWFLTLNGFRKSCIITTSANSRDGGALTSADYLETVKLMGAAGRDALDVTKVSFIIDPNTHYKSLQLTDVKTQDVFNGATIENGKLSSIYGYEVLVSPEMHKGSTNLLANTAGKVDTDTQGNNTTGSILAVRWDRWKAGFRRRLTIETERVPRADATEITALMRMGLTQNLTEGAAISYNLTV